MPLSWNEIKSRAFAFAKEFENDTSEDAEAKSFWDKFFDVFGISRRRVATFEEAVKKGDNKQGFIDLLWKGVILVEHKSRGKDLDKAFQQAKDYFPGLKEHELPKFILVSDFQRFRLYNLDTGETASFELRDFANHVHLFGFIAGYEKRTYKEEDPVNIKAAELMGRLHDRLEEVGYTGHDLERYLVRLLFCLFADDTNIFEKGIFLDYIDRHTKPDGSDLAMHLASLFHTLNTPREKRLKNLDEALGQFPYVNGKLFAENLMPAAFDSKMREMLLEACGLDWGKISPAIFGSMFQAVMNPKERRNLGAHYTSEKNIQKVIKPLFLDDLYAEFEKAKGSSKRLNELHSKIAKLHFLDPACGCGNFLIISYRELRQLEIAILRELNKSGQGFLDVREIIQVDVDQFAGIEYDEFPALVAEVAMWLMDHQMNMKVSDEFGQYFVRLPLTKAAKIVHGNALRIDWADVVPQEQLSYILGNPPFVGKHYQSAEQKHDLNAVFANMRSASDLDYISAWFYKAAQFIKGTGIEVGFVSTNSITQGEQIPLLWNSLLNDFKIQINFAHKTFKWSNEAKGNAAVHCVIIGFANFSRPIKVIFDYESISSEPHVISVNRINPYLNSGPVILVNKRSEPICPVPKMRYGNKPTDDGNYLFDDNEKMAFLSKEPGAEKYFRKFIGAVEFINGISRWCLWLKGARPEELKRLPMVMQRIENVKRFREASSAEPTRKAAAMPSLFFYTSQPDEDYLVVPETSSERREYIPIAYIDKEVIASNKIYLIPSADHYLFGMLCSKMHMVWVKYISGRLKSDFSYSGSMVYNTFPFSSAPNDTQKKKVEEAAQSVLDVRAKYPGSSLADLYDPVTMPPDLVKAHQALDRAVDLCYRPQAFVNELGRIEFLFGLYEQYTAPMFGGEGKKKKRV